MENFLKEKIAEAGRERSKLFCAFLTLGFPNLEATEKLILEFERIGVDIVELGFPFSDPLADGPTIQYSSEQALRKGVQMQDAFRLAERLRRRGCKMPLVFFTYLNPVYSFGLQAFAKRARTAGFDGLIVPDLPPGEEPVLEKECIRQGLLRTFLVTPTTLEARAKKITRATDGFIYYVSLRGVTGARKALPQELNKNVKRLKKLSAKPVLIGFGVSTPKQARDLGALSDGVIVGSAIVESLRRFGGLGLTVNFVKRMVRGLKSKG